MSDNPDSLQQKPCMARAMQGFYIIYKNLIEFCRRSGGKI